MGITDTQSYGLVIRDVFYDALADREPYFASFKKRKTKMLQVQHELLPYLGVYIIDETMLPDGEPNAGCIRFSHTLRIGFSVMVANNDPVVAEQCIDAAYWRIMNRLWCDQYIMNLLDTYNPTDGSQNPDNVRIESLTRGVRRHVFGSSGFSNETPVAEMQYDVSCFYRTMWFPDITDDLLEIDVRTGVKIGDTQEQMDKRQQFHGTYVFEPQQQESQHDRRIHTHTAQARGVGAQAAADRTPGADQERSPEEHDGAGGASR
ncbi:hypothetical protein [Bradyrhizobium neotropicale]|uniref:hypothetical protein n=1 Tax=Bradyrhizobium neotropicale TaxID=1497615 RepID=UPI001AD697A9|nr:hypothetical protein [Bradyrhizobium neotropicale]MBO4221957.1 hypothetical protein [Bradyrhizobium neotropicale]